MTYLTLIHRGVLFLDELPEFGQAGTTLMLPRPRRRRPSPRAVPPAPLQHRPHVL